MGFRGSLHRSRTRVAALGGVALALVECRTPPPLPRTPAEPPPPSQVRSVPPRPIANQRTTPHALPKSEPAVPAHAAEQRELAERYAKSRSLGVLRGEASYYGRAFAGRRTASGEIFDPQRYTAAHRTLPFGTVLRVTRLDTGGVVYVRVTDRGPFGKRRRILDLSQKAAESLGMLRVGIAEVRAEIVERGVARAKQKRRRKNRTR